MQQAFAYFTLCSCLVLLFAGFALFRILIKLDLLSAGLFIGAVFFLSYPLLFLLLHGKLEIPFWLTNVNIGLRDIIVEQQDKALAILFIYILEILLLIAILGVVKRYLQIKPFNQLAPKFERRIYFSSLIAYLVLSIALLVSSNLYAGGHWYEARKIFIENSGTEALLIIYSIWGLRLIIISQTFELIEKKLVSKLSALSVIAIVIGYELRFVGNRVAVLMFAVAGLLYLVRRYGIYKITPLILATLPFGLIMAVYQQVRSMLFTTPANQIIRRLFEILLNSDPSTTLLTAFEYTDTVVLLNILSDVGTRLEAINGSTFLRIFTWIIPRSVWAEKPLTITLQVGNVYLPGIAPIPLTFGEFHFNFNIFGLIIFFFAYCMIFVILRLVFEAHIESHYYLSFLVGFLFFRLPIADMVIIVVFSVIIYKLLNMGVRFRLQRSITMSTKETSNAF